MLSSIIGKTYHIFLLTVDMYICFCIMLMYRPKLTHTLSIDTHRIYVTEKRPTIHTVHANPSIQVQSLQSIYFPLNSYVDEGEINEPFLNFFALTSQSKLGSPPLSTTYSRQRLSSALCFLESQTYSGYSVCDQLLPTGDYFDAWRYRGAVEGGTSLQALGLEGELEHPIWISSFFNLTDLQLFRVTQKHCLWKLWKVKLLCSTRPSSHLSMKNRDSPLK